ncbi:MAG: leucine-rich repeat domain-containing protein [Limisphaerales bacterium]
MSIIELFLSPEAVARRRIAEAARTGAGSLNLSCMKLRSLPPEIGMLPKLHILHLWHNRLTSLPPQIGRCAQLEELYLSDNHLMSLPDSLQHLSHLKRLYLHGNPKLHLPDKLLGHKWEAVMSSGCAPASPQRILEHYFHRHSL